MPSAYLRRATQINGHHLPSTKDRRWQQYERPPNHLDTSPENIVQMYGQLVKQGRTAYSSPKSSGYQKSASQDSHVIKQGESKI